MTDSLRDALRDAAGDGMPMASGATGRDLLRRGHRRAWRRRASGTTVGGLVLAALVGVPFATGALSGADGGPAATDPSHGATTETDVAAVSFEVRSHSQLEDACSNIDDFGDWAVAAAMKSEHHTTAVLMSPDGERWATCIGNNDGMASVLSGMKVDETPGYGDLRVGSWWDGCETGAEPRVCSWWLYGQVPPGVARMTFESADGRTSDAVVRDGWFVWQSGVDAIDVFNQPLWVTLYDADGGEIDRRNVNPDPGVW